MNRKIIIIVLIVLLLGNLTYTYVLHQGRSQCQEELDKQAVELDSVRQALTDNIVKEERVYALAEAAYFKAKHLSDSLKATKNIQK